VTRGNVDAFGEIVWCNRVLMRTSNTIALHGVTRKERAKTRLMQIFVRSSGERNLSASHNLENTVVTILIGMFVIEILWCSMKNKILCLVFLIYIRWTVVKTRRVITSVITSRLWSMR